MKKLVVLSDESVFAGVVHCGIAEMTDTLANALARDYSVSIVCPNGNGLYKRAGGTIQTIEEGVYTCRFSNVTYYMIDHDKWDEKVVGIIEQCEPDIFHNIGDVEIISKLNVRPAKCVCTFDSVSAVTGKESYLPLYDSVITNSVAYANELLNAGDALSELLSTLDFHGITSGIMDTVFNPANGFLIPAAYTPNDQSGKQICKMYLQQSYGIPEDSYICLMMTRLSEEKNILGVISAVSKIKETGGVLIVVGKGNEEYEKKLSEYSASDGLIYINRWVSPLQIGPLGAGSDFFLYPSIHEVCGLMPMTASRYGTVPIVTLNGGLADNFTDDNAIVVYNNNVVDAITRTAALYSDSTALTAKRKVCMEEDFSWTTRKAGYIELYEKE